MKHRGRHRRRRRGRALRAGLAGTALALTAAATLISTSQATNGEDPGGLRPLTSASEIHKLRLHEHRVDEAALDTLTEDMGGAVGVREVLASANHRMRDRSECRESEKAALPVEPAASRAYCWEEGDAHTQRWIPQSVTTSGDADEDGRWDGDRVILAGWTHNDRKAGEPASDESLARVAFIDANDPDDLTYRWVLLVAPTDGGKDFTPVRSRAGGMVWYQDKLIVTARNGSDDRTALHVFDMRRILRADVIGPAVGRTEDGHSARGYRYVLPAVGSYRPAGGRCTATHDDAVPCLSSISLDRTSTPASLVATEASAAGEERSGRLWRYSLSGAADGAGPLAVDRRGNADADEAYETEAGGIQGVLSHRADNADEASWYTGRTTDGPHGHGTLWRQDDDGADAARCTADRTLACWGRHTESLSYWPQTDEVWTLTRRAVNEDGKWEPPVVPERVLYAVPMSALHEAID